jgi:DNA-binding MarR family transcriptional regulator
MERAKLVVRTSAPDDRRFNIVKLTADGKKLLAEVEPLYAKLVKKIMAALKETEQKRMIGTLEKIRCSLG